MDDPRLDTKIFTRCCDFENSWRIDVYEGNLNGYASLEKAFAMTPPEIISEVSASNLRGRGGAGFPTGRKWGFLPKKSNKPKYLVINADEGEPGTFKDRLILERDPHRLIEGCIIASHTLGVETCYIYIRGELQTSIRRVEAAIAEAREKGYLGKERRVQITRQHPLHEVDAKGAPILDGDGAPKPPAPIRDAYGDAVEPGASYVAYDKAFKLDIYVHPGAGAYICGEETALLESLEGKQGQPRMKPPFPAVVGLFGCPTIINNVETIAALPSILHMGGSAFANDGFTPPPGLKINGVPVHPSGGIKMYCISGHVVRPGVYEAPHGIPMRELIYGERFCQGIRHGKALKAVIPGGSSCPVLTPDQIDVTMDFDSLKTLGSLFGTGGIVVMDEDTCMVRVASNLAHFYHDESCGQCTPCREGTGWLVRVLDNIEAGRATPEDLDLLLDVCENIEGNTICPHGDAAAMAVRSYVKKFRHEFIQHIEQGRCPSPEWGLPGVPPYR